MICCASSDALIAQASRLGIGFVGEHVNYGSGSNVQVTAPFFTTGAFLRYGIDPSKNVRINFGIGSTKRLSTSTLRYDPNQPSAFVSNTEVEAHSVFLDVGVAFRGFERKALEVRYTLSVLLSGVQRAAVQVTSPNGPSAYFERHGDGQPGVVIRPGVRIAHTFGRAVVFTEAGYGFVIRDEGLGEEPLGLSVRSIIPKRKGVLTLNVGVEFLLGDSGVH